MNLYAHDLSLFDFAGFSDDPFIVPVSVSLNLNRSYSSSSNSSSIATVASSPKPKSPPSHRHDGTSPLPLGMDWSSPPSKWDGWDSIWPHDHNTGWSYCVSIPYWSLVPKSNGGLDPVVFYRVQVGIQSPEGVTTIRGLQRRFSDFLQLFSEVKKAFPYRTLPPAPSKKMLRMKSEVLLEERRCALEDWMEKLLSDIDISRSAPVGTFLELEAAARSHFHDVNQQTADANLSAGGIVHQALLQTNPEVSVLASSSSIVSDQGKEYRDGTEHEIPGHERDKIYNLGLETSTLETNLTVPKDISAKDVTHILENMEKHSGSHDHPDDSANFNLQLPRDIDKHHNLNRVLNAEQQQRLATPETDLEDLIARLNQEIAMRQYLTIKVKDLELDLETTRENCKENMQQGVLIERERFNQVQWDMEELRRQCLEMEQKLKSEQDAKACEESEKTSLLQENKMLSQQLELARHELENLQKDHYELELKSKTDVKLLVKEVKSLRSSQSELKQELRHLMKDKLEAEKIFQKERQKLELATTVNAKLLHECEILRNRLRECSVDFMIKEEGRLIVDTPTASEAVDLLTTSDNRIGLLLAEAQLLAEDVTNSTKVDATSETKEGDATDGLRKMLTEILIDNAGLRMQANSLIRCAIMSTQGKSDGNDDEEVETPRKTVLSKFLEG